MKKILKNTFLAVMAGFFLLAIALSLGRSTFAQTSEGTALEAQIGNLVSTLEKVFLEEKNSGGGGAIMAAAAGSGIPNPTCLDNYSTWPHSNTYLPDVPWNLDFMPRESSGWSGLDPYVNEQFVDLNGDGLADYIYKYSVAGASNTDQTCVYLNNGAGYDLVYRCIATVNISPLVQNYYGDCADI